MTDFYTVTHLRGSITYDDDKSSFHRVNSDLINSNASSRFSNSLITVHVPISSRFKYSDHFDSNIILIPVIFNPSAARSKSPELNTNMLSRYF